MRKKITLSMQDFELAALDKLASELGLNRSACVKSLIFQRINAGYDTFLNPKRRLTDHIEKETNYVPKRGKCETESNEGAPRDIRKD